MGRILTRDTESAILVIDKAYAGFFLSLVQSALQSNRFSGKAPALWELGFLRMPYQLRKP